MHTLLLRLFDHGGKGSQGDSSLLSYLMLLPLAFVLEDSEVQGGEVTFTISYHKSVGAVLEVHGSLFLHSLICSYSTWMYGLFFHIGTM